MPMTPVGLQQAIVSALGITNPAAQAAYLQLATAIITYIAANAVVATSDSGTIVGVAASVPPAAVSGTCSGSGVGTIS